jgi:hypothetical protein
MQPNQNADLLQPLQDESTFEVSRMELFKRFARGILFLIGATIILLVLAPKKIHGSILYVNGLALLFALVFSVVMITLRPIRRKQFLEHIKSEYARLTVEQELYLRIGIIFLLAVPMSLFGSVVGSREFLILALLFVSYVVCRDILRWYKMISETLLGKAVITIGFAAASTIAYGLAGQLITEAIHVTPTNFSRSSLITGIAVIPVLLLFAGSMMAAIGIASLSLIMLPLMLPKFDRFMLVIFAGTWTIKPIPYPLLTRMFQVLLYVTIGLALSKNGQASLHQYGRFLSNRFVPEIVYEFDMYHGKECEIAAGTKLAPLGDGKYLTASRDESGRILFSDPISCSA